MLTVEKKSDRKKVIRVIERHLRNYKTYKVAIKNLQKRLDYIMPNITASYELREGSTGTFNIRSSTEDAALDRLESARALFLHEQIKQYRLITESIDEAIEALGEQEKNFVVLRYFEGKSMEGIAMELHCSVQNVFKIRTNTLERLLISLSDIDRVFVEFL